VRFREGDRSAQCRQRVKRALARSPNGPSRIAVERDTGGFGLCVRPGHGQLPPGPPDAARLEFRDLRGRILVRRADAGIPDFRVPDPLGRFWVHPLFTRTISRICENSGLL
jgi:hypothetical protein